jgi:hypothetical protein
MNMQRWKRAVALLAVASFLVTGCTTLTNVPLTHGDHSIARPDVKVGESVVVTKNDGTKQKFKVTSVDSDALVGRNVRVNYTDMNSLDVQRSDGTNGHRALIIAGVVLGVAAIAAAAGGGGGSGGGY